MATKKLPSKQETSALQSYSRGFDAKRWRYEGGVYKLFGAPDFEHDKRATTAHFKFVGSANSAAGVKAVSANGVSKYDPEKRLYISGIANANIVDRMLERLDPRGLDKTDYDKNRQLLAHHNYYCPIGQVEEMTVEDDGVHFLAWIGDPAMAPLTDMQKEIRSLVAQGILKTVSVGFIPKKIKEPIFSDMGELVESAIIEKWELLELSVVAVPANQDSVFEMRTHSDHRNDRKGGFVLQKGISDLLAQLVSENTVVQSLVFDKNSFTIDAAIAWAKEHGFKADTVEETEVSYRVPQDDPNEFDLETLRTIDITEGVQAVAGAKKDGEGAGGNDAPKDELTGALKEIASLMKSNLELTQKLVAKMCPEGEGEKPKEDDEEKKAFAKRLDALEASVKKATETQEKLIETVSLMAQAAKK